MNRGQITATAVREPPGSLATSLLGLFIWAVYPGMRRRLTDHMKALERASVVKPGLKRVATAWRLHGLWLAQLLLRDVVIDDAEAAAMFSRLPQGLLVLTIHQGPWDVAGAWLASFAPGSGVYVVAKPQRLRVVDRWVRARRREVGAQNVWERTPTLTGQRCAALLRAGETVVIFIDRDYWSSESNCALFGKRTRLPVEVVQPALQAASSVIAGAAIFTGRHTAAIYYEPASPPSDPSDSSGVLYWITELTEKMVKRSPLQWHMFSDRW